MQDTFLINERKRKFLLILPLLTIPFVVFLFYALGGGKGSSGSNGQRTSALSTTLPDPVINERPTDKLSLYERASRDSEHLRDSGSPFDTWGSLDSIKSGSALSNNTTYTPPQIPLYPSVPPLNQQIQKEREALVEQRLQQLQKALNAPTDEPLRPAAAMEGVQTDISPELEQLQKMMQSLSHTTDPNPELAQAGNLLDKILDVQHPERVNQRLKKQSLDDKKGVYPVGVRPERPISDLLSSANQNESQGEFYDEETPTSTDQNTLRAVVHENQTLVSGATIKIRLEEDAYVQGQLIARGNFVYGKCSLNGERLEVSINSIRKGSSIYPVSLVAFDLDGLPGIRIPGSINRDASKESSERAIQQLSIGTLDPSIGAQAASAGIEAAKNLLSRKVKLIKVVVKAGYPLLIGPDKTNS